MGLYAVTPEGLTTGGGLLSSIVVVSGMQGALQSITLANVLLTLKATSSKHSLFLLPFLKFTFVLQPLASFAVMYTGFQLLKAVRGRLFSWQPPNISTTGGASSPGLNPGSPGGAAGEQSGVLAPREPPFQPFMGHG